MDKELNEVYRKSLKKHLENPKRAKILVYRYYKALQNVIKQMHLYIDIIKQLVEINKKFNHSNQKDYKKLDR